MKFEMPYHEEINNHRSPVLQNFNIFFGKLSIELIKD